MQVKPFLISGTCLLGLLSATSFAADKKPSCEKNNSCHQASRFQIGPYLNKDRLFNGSELIINVPSVREGARLLQQEYKLMEDCAKLDLPMPKLPRIVISGKIEGQALYNKPYNAKGYTRLDLDAAELDLYFQATSWLSSYVAIDYDPTRTTGKVFMNRGFVTLGDLGVTPFYASVGKMYVPFGRYASNMVSAPLTQDMGRTRANTIELGYQQTGDDALHAEVYFYQGVTHFQSDHETHHLEYGADTGYAFKVGNVSGEIGGGVISNLADTAGIHSTFFDNNARFLSHRIPAFDAYGSIAYKQFNVLAEYITAMRSFSAENFAFDGHGAKPSALNTEIAYNFHSFNRPSSVAIGYGHTNEALALNLPQDSYRAVYNINIIKNTNFAIEFRHDVNYSENDAADTGVNTGTLGKSDNAITAQFDYFF